MADAPGWDDPTWTALDLDHDELITGRGDVISAPGLTVLEGRARGERLYYGWPLLAHPGRDRRLRVAPMFTTALEADPAGDFVAADDEPYVNPMLLEDDLFPPEALAAVRDRTADGLPLGDAAAMSAVCADIAGLLGVPLTAPLDPDRISRPQTAAAGVHNTAVGLLAASSLPTAMLLQELDALAVATDWMETAASLLQERPRSSGARRADAVTAAMALNDAQVQALADAAAEPLTVITGPPGTGKSQLVAAIVAEAWAADESVLVASTNNGAVDVAADRANRDIVEGILLRTGKSAIREQLPAVLEDLASRPHAAGAAAGLLRRQLERVTASVSSLQTMLGQRSELEAGLAQIQLDMEQHERIIWGAPPGDQVAERAGRLGQRAARTSRARLLVGWRTRRLLQAAGVTDPAVTPEDLRAWADTRARMARLRGELDSLPARDAHHETQRLSALQADRVEASVAIVAATVQQRLHAGAALLRQRARVRANSRRHRVKATGTALQAARGWACTALSVGSNFPLQAGLFDVVVIDEASQCNLAHVIPLAYRARRLVVVGDPNQLEPVVRLDNRRIDRIAEETGMETGALARDALAYGRSSAYSLFAARVPTVHLLDEHYRCHPQIARYVNDTFYGGRLRVLTDVSAMTSPVRGLRWVDIAGRTVRPRHGSSAQNRPEAEAVARWVAEWVQENADSPVTMGVVSPFAAQAALIEQLLARRLSGGERARIDLRVGTAHRFQGDERDVIVLSPVISAQAPHSTIRWLGRQRNLLNVAVSRARAGLVVVGDSSAISTAGLADLTALHAAATSQQPARPTLEEADDARLHSESERRVYAALAHIGLTPALKPVVDGYELDFAFVEGDARLDVECDGTHHVDVRGRLRRQDLARDAVLRRMGWEIHRVPAWQCLQQPDQTAAGIRHEWDRLRAEAR